MAPKTEAAARAGSIISIPLPIERKESNFLLWSRISEWRPRRGGCDPQARKEMQRKLMILQHPFLEESAKFVGIYKKV